jgi:probable phosphoglycerate mutase
MHFRSRVGLFLMSILARHREQSVAVICHGGVINAAFDDILNIGPYRRCDVWSQNTALTCFEYHPTREEEPWVLHYMGRAEHLFDCP